MKAFQIKIDGKYLDYRIGHDVDLKKFSKHLESKGYTVEKLWQEKRHAVGVIEKENKKLFVKLSTSEGMSFTTKNEFRWNEEFNKIINSDFLAPINFDSGYFNDLFYLIVEHQEGKKLAEKPNPGFENPKFKDHIKDIIKLSELIQNSKISDLNPDGEINFTDFQKRFITKSNNWFDEITSDVKKEYKIIYLINIVEKESKILDGKLRHGDFTPWHIFLTPDNKLFLFDGERAMSKDVENYDICFFIQRIYSVLENKMLAKELLNELIIKKYDINKLRIVLASRAIGGFLDRSLHEKPNYKIDKDFMNLVLDLC